MCTRDRHIFIRDMPLSLIVRLVPGFAEIMAERRHGIAIQPEHVRVARPLGDAIRLADAVKRRVMPGKQGRPARAAGGTADIVMVELKSVRLQEPLGGEVALAPFSDFSRLIDRWIPLFVYEDDENVRFIETGGQRGAGVHVLHSIHIL